MNRLISGKLRLLCMVFSVALLSGCATTQITTPASAHSLQGIFGVVHNQQAESGRFIWVQMSPQAYRLELYGPLGLGATELSVNKEGVKLETAQGKTYRAASPEELLDEVLGWSMPISGMTSWLWGKPVPGIPFTADYDYGKRLSELDQQDWHIVYTWQDGVIHKMVMSQDNLKVTIIFNYAS